MVCDTVKVCILFVYLWWFNRH